MKKFLFRHVLNFLSRYSKQYVSLKVAAHLFDNKNGSFSFLIMMLELTIPLAVINYVLKIFKTLLRKTGRRSAIERIIKTTMKVANLVMLIDKTMKFFGIDWCDIG